MIIAIYRSTDEKFVQLSRISLHPRHRQQGYRKLKAVFPWHRRMVKASVPTSETSPDGPEMKPSERKLEETQP